MKYKHLVIIPFLALALVSCAKTTIDTSSDETMKASIQKVRDSLSDEKKQKFDEALQIVAFSNVDMKDIFAGNTGTASMESKIKSSIQGKSGDDVIAMAESIKKDRADKERTQALSEIKELEAKQAKAQQARIELAKFKVERSRFYKERQEFGGPEPIIELTVINGTSHAISRAYFKGTISSPGRSVPWLKEDFNYDISGGLEPGEKATWHLSPNMFSAWGTTDVPPDAVLTVDVEQLDGANGESLFSTRDFDEDDAKRLAELKKTVQ